jgi:hypothetical protein
MLCGWHDEFGGIAMRLAWYREGGPETAIVALPRCLDVEACRSRVAANGETWPLLERGEEPGSRPAPLPPRRRLPEPTEPPLPAPPDAPEGETDAWF